MANCHGFFSLLCLGRAATVQTYHPTKNFRFFSFLSPVFGEQPPKHAVDEGSEESIVQRPNGQVRSFRGPPSPPSFSTGPWSSCIVTGHDRLMTVENNAPTACRMPVDCIIPVHGAVNFQATARGLPEVFHVSARSGSIAWIFVKFVSCNRSEVFRPQANDVTWPSLVLRVHACMEVNETGLQLAGVHRKCFDRNCFLFARVYV